MPTAQPWTHRVFDEYRAGNLTAKSVFVLTTLRTFRGHGGACWPSHETLASRAGCCVRTVQRALHQARELGLVSWSERRVRVGWRWLRTSNWYSFATPQETVHPGQRAPRPASATTGHLVGGGESLSKKEAIKALMLEAAAAPDLLERRRIAFTAQQMKARGIPVPVAWGIT